MQEPQQLVLRLLNTSDIERVVPRLPADVLYRLVDRCGLEACAPIVALATPPQLQRLLDLDLWRAPTPGADERLDTDRFGEWLEVLLQAGADVAIDRLAAMDPDLVVAGLADHVSAADGAAVAGYISLDGEHVEGRAATGARVSEVGGFVLAARRLSAWDAIVELLANLHAARPQLFHRIMRGCVALSDAGRELDGCDALADARGQHLADVSIDRETRRDREGFVAAAEARAFLQAARAIALDADRPAPDATAHAYLRDRLHDPLPVEDEPGEGAVPAVHTVMNILAEEGVLRPPRALLTAGASESPPPALVHAFAASHAAAQEELTFLANAVLAGCAIRERALTPPEAADLVAATCNLGLENWPRAWASPDLTTAFRIGWTLLHRRLCGLAARTLYDVLGDLHCVDRDVEWSLQALRHDLQRHIARGEPWRARPSLDAILALDAAAWAVLRSFMDECPALHPAMRRGARTVDPNAFTFAACNADLAAARDYLAQLPAHLAG